MVLDTRRRPYRGSNGTGMRVNEGWPETSTYGVTIWGRTIVSSSRDCNINKYTIRIVQTEFHNSDYLCTWDPPISFECREHSL